MKVFTVCRNRMVRFLDTKGSVLQETYSKSYHIKLLLNRILRVFLDRLEFSSIIPGVLSQTLKGSQEPIPTSLALLSHKSAASFSSKAKGFGVLSCSPCWKRNHIYDSKFSFLLLWGILEVRSKIPENWRTRDNTCISL